MTLEIAEKDFSRFIMIGDRLLVKPKSNQEKTKTGLYLPANVVQKEQIQSGYVIKTGPGYPVPTMAEDEEWKDNADEVYYIPLQAKEGDLAIYMQNSGHEIVFKGEKYLIIPHSAILMVIRDEHLFE